MPGLLRWIGTSLGMPPISAGREPTLFRRKAALNDSPSAGGLAESGRRVI